MNPIRLDTDPRFAGYPASTDTNPAQVRAWLWRRIETGELPVSDLANLDGARLASPAFPALASVVASAAAWASRLASIAPSATEPDGRPRVRRISATFRLAAPRGTAA